ncbi:unnamed protein product [Enterobius vermicularis]|uniref:RSN1_7TM domain-containing protein n=1 Tax=Enterobius vermicularis TaxID=51028 RepID=A0A0N4VBD6_ENTVE|nr:unnamed protein product [Enterobius vermicularis]
MEMDNNIRFEKESCRNLKSHFEELWKLDSPAYRIAVCGCSNAKIPTLIFVLLHFLATLSAAVFLMSVTIPAEYLAQIFGEEGFASSVQFIQGACTCSVVMYLVFVLLAIYAIFGGQPQFLLPLIHFYTLISILCAIPVLKKELAVLDANNHILNEDVAATSYGATFPSAVTSRLLNADEYEQYISG